MHIYTDILYRELILRIISVETYDKNLCFYYVKRKSDGHGHVIREW